MAGEVKPDPGLVIMMEAFDKLDCAAQRVLVAMARAIMIGRDDGGCIVKDWAAEARDNPHVAQALRQAELALDAALPAIIGAVLEDALTAFRKIAEGPKLDSSLDEREADSAWINYARDVAQQALRALAEEAR